VNPLSKEDSWSFFCVHAFRPPSNVPCELEALAHSIAEECQGLPLALKVIGRAMFGKTSRELQWKAMLKKLRNSCMQERTVEVQLYERLKLGYDLLFEDDQRLQDCFLYFAAFPEDSEFDFEEILWYWIGEGLVPAHGGDDPRADTFSLINKLWERSFIEAHEKAHRWNGSSFKVHDVMRDLAFYILEKDSGIPPARQLYFYRAGQNLEEMPKDLISIPEVRRLSLDTNYLQMLPESLYAPELVSLLLGKSGMKFLPVDFLSSFPKLQILDLRVGRFERLPEEIGNLKNLVYLNLSGSYCLVTLPDTVGKLHMLKYLNLCDCKSLEYLPSGICDLTSLQVLLIKNCDYLTWIEQTPSGMERAKSLFMSFSLLPFAHVCQTIEASLEDICGCVNLTNLSICGKTIPVKKLPQYVCTYKTESSGVGAEKH
jgi:disease resistance protein RPS2